MLAAEHAAQDQVGEDGLLLLPPGLAVVPGEAVPSSSGPSLTRSITSYQPPRCGSLPTAGMTSAILRARSLVVAASAAGVHAASGSRRS